jgi:hypothetical protein
MHAALGFSSHASWHGFTGDPFYCHYVLGKSELACLPSRLPSIFIVRKIDKISRRNFEPLSRLAGRHCGFSMETGTQAADFLKCETLRYGAS